MKPERLSLDRDSADAEFKWKHWHTTFTNFLSKLDDVTANDKLGILINFLSADVYTYISEATTFDTAIEILENLLCQTPKHDLLKTFAGYSTTRGWREGRPVLSRTTPPQ